jgi:SAM-dependent methyltransferase
VIWFRPDRPFVAWLIAYAQGRLIVDVGCGEGELLSRIFQMGGDAVGVDPMPKQSFTHVGERRLSPEVQMRMAGRFLPREAPNLVTRGQDLLLVFARPSHMGWVEDAMCDTDPTSEILYISKPENVSRDLWFPCSVEELSAPVCREGERVYRVTVQERARNEIRSRIQSEMLLVSPAGSPVVAVPQLRYNPAEPERGAALLPPRARA